MDIQMLARRISDRIQINDLKDRLAVLVGKAYRADGKAWQVSTVLLRHDGVFLFLRRDEGKRIIMREVLLDMDCIIVGGVDEGSGSQTGTEDRSCKTGVCQDAAHRDMEDGKVGSATAQGEAGRRDIGTGVGEVQA